VRRRLTLLLICVFALLVGAASPARADVTTVLPVTPFYEPYIAVDPVGQHVFVAASEGTSSIYVLDFEGNLVKTITGEAGASGMAVDTATHTLYVADYDSTQISEIDTQTLTETGHFAAPTGVFDPAVAGGKLWFASASSGSIYVANLDGSNINPAGIGDGQAVLLTSSADGKLLAFGDHEVEPPNVDVYDVSGATPKLLSSAWNPGGDATDVSDIAFDPSSSNLYLSDGNTQSFSFAGPALTSSALYPTSAYSTAVAVSPDGKYVAAGISTGIGYGTNVYVFPNGDTTPLQTWSIGPGIVEAHSLAFSPDGRRLFALTTDPGTGHLALEILGDIAIASGPNATTYATTASFSFTSRDATASFECSLDNAAWQSCSSPADYSDLTTGTHTFAVRNVDGSPVDPMDASQTWTVTPPNTYLNSGPGTTTTSTDASFSFSSDDSAATFQCNLDDAGWSSCTSPAGYSGLSFGSHTFAVRALNDAGAIDPTGAKETWTIVSPPPPGSVVGVSIDNGDYATNSPDVQLDVVWPEGTTLALISNDGGFGPNGGTKTLPVAASIPWTLASAGSDRLPQIVYVRFPDSPDPLVTFSDNIVLDTTAPSITAATLAGTKGQVYKVRLRAKEKISGISQVRFSTARHGGAAIHLSSRQKRGVRNLSRTVGVKLGARPRWVRARSAAGTWSKWHRIR
jgi:hypothetical protein